MAENDIIALKELAGESYQEIALAASDLKLGTTSGLPLRTGTNGVIEAGSFGTSAGQFAEGNHTHTASAITSGTFDNARINWAAPSAIGSTTSAAGAFTTLTANTSLTLNGTGAAELINAGAAAAGPLRIYNTFTSATNHERGFLRWSSNVFQIGTEKGSGIPGGTARALEFQTDGVTRASVTTGGNFWINNQLILGTSVFARVTAPSDGVVTLFDSGQASFNRLQFGGTTSSFPALKRSSATLQVRLADDSAFAAFECAGLTLNGNLTASTRNIVTDTTTGTRIGTGTTQLLGFWNATPASQPAAVADATDAASTQARLNDLLSRLRTIGIIAT